MKALGVIGYHHTGKTTVVTTLIRQLTKKGFRVATIKDIHAENYHADTPGTNTWHHLQAGACQVFAKGLHDSALLLPDAPELKDIVKLLNGDFLIIEGLRSAPVPKILCAETIDQLEELYDDTIIAISGKLASAGLDWSEPPVYDIFTQSELLAQLVINKSFDLLPLNTPKDCSMCGLTCYDMATAILKGEKQRSDCLAEYSKSLQLKVDNAVIPLKPYVRKTLSDVLKAYLSNLNGVDINQDITITIS